MPPWTIIFEIPLTDIQLPVQAKARSDLQEIAHGISGVDPDSPFWRSVREAGLRLTVGEWLFTYLVDEQAQTMRVVSAVRRR